MEIHLEPPGVTGVQLALAQKTSGVLVGDIKIIGAGSGRKPERRLIID